MLVRKKVENARLVLILKNIQPKKEALKTLIFHRCEYFHNISLNYTNKDN